MRAEPWLDEIRHGINSSISFGCDDCATTRRTRDVAFCPSLTSATNAGMSGFRGWSRRSWVDDAAF
jgi:hypothetical protein